MSHYYAGRCVSAGIDNSENVRLCMGPIDSQKVQKRAHDLSNYNIIDKTMQRTSMAHRSFDGCLIESPFLPQKAMRLSSSFLSNDSFKNDANYHKPSRILSPQLPLSDIYYSSLDAERLRLRQSQLKISTVVSHRQQALYKVALTTADIQGAGTSASIFISIRGDRASLPRTKLRKSLKSKRKSAPVKLNPGSTQIFPLNCPDLGELESLLIEHDGLEPKDSWLLQGVEIMNNENKKLWLFTCNHWLSLYKEDGKVSRELFAFKSMRTKYEIVVITGDVLGGETDSRVFVTLCGRTGISPQLLLTNDDNKCFERGQSTRFVISATCVGPITKIKICQDESGFKPNWYLDRVCVTDLKHPQWRYYFQCKNWLSSSVGDGAVMREIRGTKEITGIAARTEYKISIYTANKPGAGTRAEVFLQIIGEFGETDIIRTRNEEGFRSGSVYELVTLLRQLGSLKEIRIGHNNTGPQPHWLLDKVIINDMEMSRVFEFPCGKWFSDVEGEQLTRILPVKPKPVHIKKCKYEMRITTGNRSKANTSSKVYVTLSGPENKEKTESSGRIWINGGKFAKGRTDVVVVELEEMLSPVSQLFAGISPDGNKPAWFLDDIVVFCPQTEIEQTFICSDWLIPSSDSKTQETLLIEDISKRKTKEEKNSWLIEVITSDMPDSGTKSKVTMVLYGKDGKTANIELPREKKFERDTKIEFRTELAKVGIPYKLRVQHDNSGSNPSWHLDKIIMTLLSSNDVYEFNCDRWLSDSHDDKCIVRELPATGPGIKKKAAVCQYKIQVFTGNCIDAGTDANVFINLYGDHGDTGDRILIESDNIRKFQKNQMDEFVLEAVKLGDINKIKLGHDSQVPGTGWFVDKVVVWENDDEENCKTFLCNCWFDSSKDDRLIVREFTKSIIPGNVTYDVIVKTGNKGGAGTDANVFINIFGSTGETGTIQLKTSSTSKNKFESGSTDVFKLDSEDIGNIKTMRLSHDDTGAASAWYVDHVIIVDPKNGLKYTFLLNKWLNKNQLKIDCEPSKVEKIDKAINYQITVFTGNVTSAGTDAKVFVQMYGLDSKTDEIVLENGSNCFERGNKDLFKIIANDVGVIQKIRVGHDGKKPGAGWFLDKVLIEKVSPSTDIKNKNEDADISDSLSISSRSNTHDDSDSLSDNSFVSSRKKPPKSKSLKNGTERYWFFCKRWLAVDEDDGMIVRELLSADENGKFLSNLEELEYKVSVKTGNLSGAGTDSNVFLTIFGKKTDSGERALKTTINASLNKFEKNSLDIFSVKAIELGSLEKIKIRHDDQGGASAWYLEYVLINDGFNEYLFPCFSWLAKNMGDGSISRDIFLATPEIHLDWKNGKLTPDKFKIYQEDELEKYEVNVYTSKKAFAGTDANVYIVLYGNKNDSGAIPLKTSLSHSNKFESGNCDKFIIKSADIGDLKKIKIGHDNSLAGADWHLEKVEVEALKLGQLWVFPCNEWISKTKGDGKLEKDLYPQSQLTIQKRPRVTYEITTHTSDIYGSGTSANVYVQIYGRNDYTEQRMLANEIERPQKFKKGAVDIFYLEMEDVEDPIEKIRIGHDSKGISPGWHLNKVIVKRLMSDKSKSIAYQFPCNRWLAKNEDDRAIERELLADQIIRTKFSAKDGKSVETVDDNVNLNQMKKYVIRVFTGDETGTNANVFLKVYGENGDTGERQLTYSKTHKDKFEKNNMDEFDWEAVDLGKLQKIDIRHDNTGLIKKDWFLKKVEVIDKFDNETYVFQCERWLSKSKEDKKIMRTLYATGYSGERSPSVSSHSKAFGSVDSVDSKGGAYSFENDEDNIEDGRKKIPYTITVKTGPEKDMGSEGPIWIRLYGAKNVETRKIRLQKLGSDYFSPDSKEIISVEAADVGNLKQVQVTNEGVNKESGWFLKSITIGLPTSGKSYHIPCGTWLSKFHDERKTSRIFNVVDKMISTFVPKVPYDLIIYTGDCENAGTNSSLFIQLFGSKGQSSVYPLEKSADNFERGHIDKLRIEMEDVGEMKKIRIENDGKGIRPHWFLEKIEIENDKKYEFVFNDYLSKQLGQAKSLTADLMLNSNNKKTPYSISVKTSNLKSANTSAAVFIRLFGENGDSGELALNKPEKPGKVFQVDQINVFMFPNITSLGDLTRCQIWHNNTGFSASWHLEYVEVKELNTRKSWMFPCNKWLSSTEDDKQIFRDLICNSAPEISKRLQKETDYEVTVITGDKKDAGMPDDVWLVFHGTLSYSDDCLMENSVRNKLFSKGNVDQMKYKTNNLGSLKEILFGAVKNKKSDVHRTRWYCHEIQVKDLATLKTYIFEVRSWINVDDAIIKQNGRSLVPAKVVEDPAKVKASEIRKKGIINYEVLVKTGNEFGSGTNANVSITLYGDDMDSGKRPLIQKGKDAFGRGQEDKFTIESSDLGEITKLRIEHDDTGLRSDWLLESIQIINQSNNKVWRFPCGEWLSKNKGDNKLWKLLSRVD